MSLVKNSIFNLMGFAIPTIIAIPCLGIISRSIGAESFGIFTLTFAVVGYASIFDAGITRAVIREISIHRNDIGKQKEIIGTATVAVFVLSIIASLLIFFFSNALVHSLKVSDYNFQGAILSFKILALIIPFYLISQIWLALLEGQELFGKINIQRVLSSSLLALIPTMFVIFNPKLIYATLGLLISRIITFAISYLYTKDILKTVTFRIEKNTLKRLIKFGGWMTVSNIISPFMVYFDRFVVSNMLGASKVAFYSAPSEGVARLLNIPTALSRVLFAKISFTQSLNDRKALERKSYVIISLVILPVIILGIVFSSYILSFWLGGEYGEKSALVFQVLLIGFFFNSIAQIPFSIIQARGNSKVTALIHCLEILPYFLLLYYLTINFGIVGSAIAWSIRTCADFILLFIFSRGLNRAC